MLVKNCMAFLTFLTCVQAVSNATLCVIKLICFVWEKLRSMSEESGKETPQNGEGMEATTMKDDNIKRGIVPCENPPSPGTATFYTPQGDKNQRAVGGRKLHLQRKCGTMKSPVIGNLELPLEETQLALLCYNCCNCAIRNGDEQALQVALAVRRQVHAFEELS